MSRGGTRHPVLFQSLQMTPIFSRVWKWTAVAPGYSTYGSPSSKCCPPTSSVDLTWELVRNAESQASPWPPESEPAFSQALPGISDHITVRSTVRLLVLYLSSSHIICEVSAYPSCCLNLTNPLRLTSGITLPEDFLILLSTYSGCSGNTLYLPWLYPYYSYYNCLANSLLDYELTVAEIISLVVGAQSVLNWVAKAEISH